MTWICDKHFFPFGLPSKMPPHHTADSSQNNMTLRRPVLPPSWQRERGREKKKMTAALDLTSNTGERVEKKKKKRRWWWWWRWGEGGRKRLHLCCDSLLKEPGKCRVISLSFPPFFFFLPPPPLLSIPSISPSHPSLCVSLAHQNPALITISAKPRVLDGIWKHAEDPRGKKKKKEEEKKQGLKWRGNAGW